jgi:ABC-2 type transport system permease protein
MRWLQIARKDFDDARRERQLYYLLGLFALGGLGLGYIIGGNPGSTSPRTLPFALLNVFAFLAPISALTISQADIVGKRSTGELSVLLSLPFSRLSIVTGSYLGRAAVMTAILAPGFVLAPLVTALRGAPVDATALLGAFLLVWALGLVFTAIALGISALTRSTTVAAGGSFGVFLLFVFQLWTLLPEGVLYLVNGLSWPRPPLPTWTLVFDQLSPFATLRNLAHPFFTEILNAFPLAPGSVPPDPPAYQGPVFAAVATLAWIVLPLAVGYYRFQRRDL